MHDIHRHLAVATVASASTLPDDWELFKNLVIQLVTVVYMLVTMAQTLRRKP